MTRAVYIFTYPHGVSGASYAYLLTTEEVEIADRACCILVTLLQGWKPAKRVHGCVLCFAIIGCSVLWLGLAIVAVQP